MQQPAIYGKGKHQLAMRATGQWLAMGRKSKLLLLTIELMVAPQRLAPTRTDAEQAKGNIQHSNHPLI
jgi:hypothetical protein